MAREIYKFSLSILGALVLLTGLVLCLCTYQALGAQEFVDSSVLLTVMSGDALNVRLTFLAIFFFSVVLTICGLCSCHGVYHNNRWTLCLFVFFGAFGGAALVLLFSVSTVFVGSGYPVVLKEVNRICAAEEAQALPLASRPVSLKSKLGCDTVARRLFANETVDGDQVSDGMLPDFMLHAQLFSALHAEAQEDAEARRQVARVGEASEHGRRLMVGTTEESFLTRVCSRLGRKQCPSPCYLVDLLCQPPEGYDMYTACVCDRVGPRKQDPNSAGTFQLANCPSSSQLCQTDISGRHRGVFCTAEVDDPEVEFCFVSPLADCSNRAGAGVFPTTCKADGDACKSQAPCIMPDSKSKVLQMGKDFMYRVRMACGLMSFFVLVAAAVSCCTCVHLHTGKPITTHARCQFELMPPLDQEDERSGPYSARSEYPGNQATYTQYQQGARKTVP